MGVGLIRAGALMGVCCCQRGNQLAVMRFLMKILRSDLVGMMERCWNFGFSFDLPVSRNAFMRENSEGGDRG